MEIKRGKYRLVTEPKCMWIEELQEVKDRKTKEYKLDWRRVTGYHNNITLLANDFANGTILNSTANSMNKYLKELRLKKDNIAKMTLKRIGSLTDD